MAKKRDSRDLQKIEAALDEEMFALAGELSQRYVEKYPSDVEGQWLRGLSLYFLGRGKDAGECINAALSQLSLDFRGAALTYLARISRDAGHFVEAEELYSQAIEAAPQDAGNYVELASMLLAFNKVLDAEAIARRGIDAEASPTSDLYFFLGSCFRAHGDLVGSYDAFCRVLDECDDEEAEAAMTDLEQAAGVRGIELPQMEEPSEAGECGSEDNAEHEPGQMVANIQQEFFVKILSGEKKIEYRRHTDYWQTRIENAGKPPFHLRIINGMTKDAPELTVVVNKVVINPWEAEYELHLGDVIDIRNWEPDIQE
ncbi:tetratricopeptide repeat protein [Schlesneria paludicola]|uniref:tetratricopeptide repeat protein n=1 Tax=Schlesneria paludicola TaxID=360056 RepID=UPI000299EFC4|nr:tetratricopeptide repeat protein [Schlesneria paludicola]